MDPQRLDTIIRLTLANAKIPPALARGLTRQASVQLFARWPLAGCALTYGDPEQLHVIAVGRQ